MNIRETSSLPGSLRRPLALSLALLLATTGAAADDKKPAGATKPALTVTTVQPTATQLSIGLSANGSIAAWQEASVGAEVNGLRLTEVRVNVGDTVHKGDVLAVFSAETVQADLLLARANLAEAQAMASDAAANAERARGLQTSGALSAQQINQYFTAEQTARAKVEAARAAVTVQQVRIKQAQVLAPDSGVISVRNATVGSVVGAGTELFRLIRQGRIEWRAEVTSAEIGRLPKGTKATVVTASGAQLQGKVRMIGPTVDAQTRSALVYVDLPSMTATGTARPGMFARGDFDLGQSAALTVPQSTVVAREGFNYVFRLNPDNRVTQLKVQTGRLFGDRVEITKGLPADAKLVANGAGFLNDGDVVRVVDGAPAAPAAAPAPAASAPRS
jgi:RND family efflux transporter MFP subunit